jgi:hypothetical protein
LVHAGDLVCGEKLWATCSLSDGLGLGLLGGASPPTVEAFMRAPSACVLRLKAGQMLFVPSGWWHFVVTIQPSLGFSSNGLTIGGFADARRCLCTQVRVCACCSPPTCPLFNSLLVDSSQRLGFSPALPTPPHPTSSRRSAHTPSVFSLRLVASPFYRHCAWCSLTQDGVDACQLDDQGSLIRLDVTQRGGLKRHVRKAPEVLAALEGMGASVARREAYAAKLSALAVEFRITAPSEADRQAPSTPP